MTHNSYHTFGSEMYTLVNTRLYYPVICYAFLMVRLAQEKLNIVRMRNMSMGNDRHHRPGQASSTSTYMHTCTAMIGSKS